MKTCGNRACFGEMVQIDRSPHDWFPERASGRCEGRADACVLLVFIDDATGKLVELQFVDSESFFNYSQAAENYFKRCGKPIAFYNDKHGVFRVNQPSAGSVMQSPNLNARCKNWTLANTP